MTDMAIQPALEGIFMDLLTMKHQDGIMVELSILMILYIGNTTIHILI
jgi:hypothetical protein